MEYLNNDDESGEAVQVSPTEYLALRKAQMRRKSFWSVMLGLFLIAANVVLVLIVLNSPELVRENNLEGQGVFSILSRSIFFLLGLVFLGGGIWGYYEARRMTVEDLVPSREALEFFRDAELRSHLYVYIILASLIAVFVAQAAGAGKDADPILIAGLVKPDVFSKGEYWRILTSGLMHAGLLHIYFNSQALFGFGSLIEIVADRSRMAIILLLSIIVGAVFSTIFSPSAISVGASGGIMGLVGYLVVYGQRRKRELPPGFLRNILVNVAFIAGIGIVGYKFIDNFAHLGGLLTGAVYGIVTIPRNITDDPRKIGPVTEGAGMIAMGVIVFIAVFTILLITNQIAF